MPRSIPLCCLTACAVLLTLGAFCPRTAQAQTVDDTGLWFAAFTNGKFDSLDEDSRVRYWFDAHYRLRDDTNGFNQSILRPGVGFALTDLTTVWAGYAWINSNSLAGNNFDEHRLWQQYTFSPSRGDWLFLHRGRLEQRWLETGDDVGIRYRQFARAQKVLTATPQWSFVVWDEAFFHLNDTDWGARSGLDQNRAFIGLGFKHDEDDPVRIEVGYLNQFINRPGTPDSMNHILSINFFF